MHLHRLDAPVLNLDWLREDLAVGGCFPMEAAAHLARELEIRHVVDVRVESRDDEELLRAHGITWLHLPTRDLSAVAMAMLDDGVRWVDERLSRGERVLIHCEHGIGRSALVALCVLVSQGLSPLDAMELAKQRRPRISPSPPQLEAYMAWCERIRIQRGLPWELPEFDVLADIAYRHLRPPTAH